MTSFMLNNSLYIKKSVGLAYLHPEEFTGQCMSQVLLTRWTYWTASMHVLTQLWLSVMFAGKNVELYEHYGLPFRRGACVVCYNRGVCRRYCGIPFCADRLLSLLDKVSHWRLRQRTGATYRQQSAKTRHNARWGDHFRFHIYDTLRYSIFTCAQKLMRWPA